MKLTAEQARAVAEFDVLPPEKQARLEREYHEEIEPEERRELDAYLEEHHPDERQTFTAEQYLAAHHPDLLGLRQSAPAAVVPLAPRVKQGRVARPSANARSRGSRRSSARAISNPEADWLHAQRCAKSRHLVSGNIWGELRINNREHRRSHFSARTKWQGRSSNWLERNEGTSTFWN